jgi:hypothetical protein
VSHALLVQLSKLRLPPKQVNDLPWSNGVAQVDNIMTAPVSFYLESLKEQLQLHWRMDVLLAFSKGIDRVMYLGTGAAGVALPFSLGMGWLKFKEKAEVEAEV